MARLRLPSTQHAWLVLAAVLLIQGLLQLWVANVFWSLDAVLERRVATTFAFALLGGALVAGFIHGLRSVPTVRALPATAGLLARWLVAGILLFVGTTLAIILLTGGVTGECADAGCPGYSSGLLFGIHWIMVLGLVAAGLNLLPRRPPAVPPPTPSR